MKRQDDDSNLRWREFVEHEQRWVCWWKQQGRTSVNAVGVGYRTLATASWSGSRMSRSAPNHFLTRRPRGTYRPCHWWSPRWLSHDRNLWNRLASASAKSPGSSLMSNPIKVEACPVLVKNRMTVRSFFLLRQKLTTHRAPQNSSKTMRNKNSTARQETIVPVRRPQTSSCLIIAIANQQDTKCTNWHLSLLLLVAVLSHLTPNPSPTSFKILDRHTR